MNVMYLSAERKNALKALVRRRVTLCSVREVSSDRGGCQWGVRTERLERPPHVELISPPTEKKKIIQSGNPEESQMKEHALDQSTAGRSCIPPQKKMELKDVIYSLQWEEIKPFVCVKQVPISGAPSQFPFHPSHQCAFRGSPPQPIPFCFHGLLWFGQSSSGTTSVLAL